MRPPVSAWVALGANLGDAAQSVRQAIADLTQHPEIAHLRASRLYRSAPHQAQGPEFVNAMVQFDTRLVAPVLLELLQSMEQQAGRERPYHHAPRTLDLDLIFYGQARIQSPFLTLPHPRWQERAFVLAPLRDISPEQVDPSHWERVRDQTISVLE